MKTIIALLVIACAAANADSLTPKEYRIHDEPIVMPEMPDGPYTADWASVSTYPQCPEWFRDAKFGIYTHWGPTTVCGEELTGRDWGGLERYPQQMYREDRESYKIHAKKYGHDKMGYKDFIPMFTAEKFDAEEWVDLFAKAGARFIGPVAIHHENFAMWDSKYTRWNSVNMGPKKDITGELAKAVRARDLKFMASFHHSATWDWFTYAHKYDGKDPQWGDLYSPPHPKGMRPTQEWLEIWLSKIDEVVLNYEPDLIWFDFGLHQTIPREWQQRMFADYYNWATAKNKAVGVAQKSRAMHQHVSIIDFERGREDRLTPYPWLTDTSLGPWFNVNSAPYKSSATTIKLLVDIVSKNGCMLLNVGPHADGSIPERAKKVLLDIGGWLDVNGEAVYNTRPWLSFGEGKAQMKSGGGFSEGRVRYSGADIRYTRSKDNKTLYATTLGRPANSIVLSYTKVLKEKNGKVELLGSDQAIKFKINAEGSLVIEVSNKALDACKHQHAFTFRITGFKLDLQPKIRAALATKYDLPPSDAVIEGYELKSFTRGGKTQLGHWGMGDDKAHWLFQLKQAGTYTVSAEVSAGAGLSDATLSIDEQSISSIIPETENFDTYQRVELGEVTFKGPGIKHVILEATDPGSWKAINVRNIRFTSK